MTDARRDGHHYRDEYPKRTERGWVHRDGEVTQEFMITQSDEQGRMTPLQTERQS